MTAAAFLSGFSTGCVVAMAAKWRQTAPSPATLLRRSAPARLAPTHPAIPRPHLYDWETDGE